MRVCLQFAPAQSHVHRTRIEYAFRLFCAIYGHTPIVGGGPGGNGDVTIAYAPEHSSTPTLYLNNSYAPRPAISPAPPPKPYVKEDDNTVLFYGVESGGEPDWLAEIFEWVSCADEYSNQARDSVGRIPFSDSYVGRHHLDPRKPYASVAMRRLQRAITRLCPEFQAGPPCPLPSAQILIVNTHDVDFFPVGRADSCRRLAKNAVISLLLNKTPATAARQVIQVAAAAVGGPDPLDQILPLVQAERSRSVTASYYFLCRRAHRRDGNYEIEEPTVVHLMQTLQQNMEVGVHGSYCSLEEGGSLASEYQHMSRLGVRPLGGRQHWLRFTLPQLIRGVISARAAYDTSIGWPYTPGYRAGASFAFPPYDFDREEPAPFLEIPLVVTDESALDGQNGNSRLASVAEVLANNRRYGWGGVSVLWHPTAFGGGQFPSRVGHAFWTLIDEGLRQHETWLSAASFVKAVWPRYADAGLLPPREFS